MTISRIKQIKRILKDDVRDPRATLQAIANVVSQPKADKAGEQKPVAVIRVFDNPDSSKLLKSVVVIDYNAANLEPRHLIASIAAAKDLGDSLFGDPEGQCDDPNCPVHGQNAADLGELLKKLQEAVITEAKKRGAQ